MRSPWGALAASTPPKTRECSKAPTAWPTLRKRSHTCMPTDCYVDHAGPLCPLPSPPPWHTQTYTAATTTLATHAGALERLRQAVGEVSALWAELHEAGGGALPGLAQAGPGQPAAAQPLALPPRGAESKTAAAATPESVSGGGEPEEEALVVVQHFKRQLGDSVSVLMALVPPGLHTHPALATPPATAAAAPPPRWEQSACASSPDDGTPGPSDAASPRASLSPRRDALADAGGPAGRAQAGGSPAERVLACGDVGSSQVLLEGLMVSTAAAGGGGGQLAPPRFRASPVGRLHTQLHHGGGSPCRHACSPFPIAING